MRVILLLSLLMTAACSTHEASTGLGDEMPGGGLSLAPSNPNVPTTEEGRYFTCPGGFARGPTIEDYRAGTADPFCN